MEIQSFDLAPFSIPKKGNRANRTIVRKSRKTETQRRETRISLSICFTLRITLVVERVQPRPLARTMQQTRYACEYGGSIRPGFTYRGYRSVTRRFSDKRTEETSDSDRQSQFFYRDPSRPVHYTRRACTFAARGETFPFIRGPKRAHNFGNRRDVEVAGRYTKSFPSRTSGHGKKGTGTAGPDARSSPIIPISSDYLRAVYEVTRPPRAPR